MAETICLTLSSGVVSGGTPNTSSAAQSTFWALFYKPILIV